MFIKVVYHNSTKMVGADICLFYNVSHGCRGSGVVRPYYRDSDVTLICSLKEGLSLTSYESLSMGVPVVSSDVGGQKELIDEQVGYIFPLYQDELRDLDNRQFSEEEINQYVIAILSIVTLPDSEKEKLHQVCQNRIEQGFTKKEMIKKFEHEFHAWKNGKGIEKREEVVQTINRLPKLVDDYSTIFHEFLKKDIESEEIWRAKLYLQEMLLSKEELNYPLQTEPLDNELALKRLHEIMK